ncbi:MAG: Clp1/GlmU family protein [Candidatus Hecatellaceae archaeon]
MPELKIEAGKTLMVSGPASTMLLEGEAHILGAPLKPGEKVTIRRWRLLPVYAVENCRLKVELGSGGSLDKYDGSTIPEGWWKAARRIVEAAGLKPLTVAVLGGVDVGKTAFTVFLANQALKGDVKVSIVDGDVGQSDLGPPCTLGAAQLGKPVFDLFFVSPERLEFAGSTTSSKVRGRLLEALKRLYSEEKQRSRLVVLNTDGWISGDGAEAYKVSLVKAVEAEVAVGLQTSGELEPVLERLEAGGLQVVRLPASPKVRARSRGERRGLRWQSYAKYFAEASTRSLSLQQVKVSGLPEPKPGVILALYAPPGRKLLGIGVALAYNRKRETLKVLTPIKGFVGEVEIGEVLPDFTLAGSSRLRLQR